MALTRTAKGTVQEKSPPSTTWDPFVNNLTITAGSTIFVCFGVSTAGISGDNLVSVTYDPAGVNEALTKDVTISTTEVDAVIFRKSNSAGGTNKTLRIVFTFSGQPVSIAVLQVEGLPASSALDVTSTGSGAGTAASTGSITSTPNTSLEVFWLGVVATEGPDGDTPGTWVNPNNAGQRLGTTGNPATSNVTVSEGFEIDTVAVTQALSKTGMTSREWAAVIATYKEASSATPLTVAVSDSADNWSDSLTGMGHGYALADTINNWAERQDIGLGLIFADDMNNLLDAILVRLSYEINLSDNAGNLADAIETQFVGAYGIAASDNVNNWGDELSGMGRGYSLEDTLALSDEIKLILDHLLSFSDTLILSDGTEIRLGYLKDFVDDLNNWLDAIQTSLAGFQEAAVADSMENWGDSISIIYGYLKDISDDLNNFVDAISILFEYRLQLSDTMTLSDAIAIEEGLLLSLSDNLQNWTDEQQLRLNYLLSIPDDLNSWTEFILVNLSYELSLTDSINNWTDFVNTVLEAPSLGVSRNVSDTLNFWKDRAEISTSLQRLGIRDYLRRYLNDVIVADPVVLISTTPHGVFKPDVHTYLRRYLNDVSPEYLVHQMDSINNWKDLASVGLN